MSEAAVAAPTRQSAAPETGAKHELLLQRKCACGQHTLAGGECAECRKKRLATQRWSSHPRPDAMVRSTRAPSDFAASERTGADLTSVRAQTPLLRTAPRIQRADAGEGGAFDDSAEPEQAVEDAGDPSSAPPSPDVASPGGSPEASEAEASPDTPSAGPGASLLVEDDAADVGTGQMRKTEFLDQLQRAVCAQADEALAAAGRSTEGCPFIAQAFGRYRGQSAARVESALRRYAPETRNARTAAEAIPILAARVRQGVERWVETGEITGVPDDAPISIPTGGLFGAISSAASGIGSLLFKAKEGGAHPGDPAAVHEELGDGRPLESGVRGRMERAFGRSFSGVRMHTDSAARRLSAEQNARAFTVGGHVAFGAGEYRPGTMAGDALIAHELAHTVQQGSGAAVQAKAASGAGYDALEADADRSAAGVVASLWGAAKGTAGKLVSNTGPALRSGLSIQRCSHNRAASTTPTTTPATPATAPASTCPTLVSLTSTVHDPVIGRSRRGSCRMHTGVCPTPRGTCGSSDTSGTVFQAVVQAPEGCTGELTFRQNILSADRQRTLADGTRRCINVTSTHRDGDIPWKGCVTQVTGPGRVTATTDDCPNMLLDDDTTAVRAADSFKMFLFWQPAGGTAAPIANVTWGWSGQTSRRAGTTGCEDSWTTPTGSHTDGTGAASTEQPVASPAIQDVAEAAC